MKEEPSLPHMDEHVLEHIVRDTAYGLVLLDRHRVVRLWNRWMEDRSRRASERVVDRPLDEVFGDRHPLPGALVRLIDKAIGCQGLAGRSPALTPHPLPLRDPANPRKWLIHSLTVRSVRDSQGNPYCLLEVEDTSHSHHRERLLRQATRELRQHSVALESVNHELARKNRQLDEFVYQVSHDLQEPLRKLSAFSDLLEEDLKEGLQEQVGVDLHYIRDSSQRMSRMVDDLLRLSQAGNSAMRWIPVPLESCVREALETLSLRTREAGARIELDSLPVVQGDPRLLTQLFQNLVGNALKFVSEEEPCVRITHEVLEGESVYGVQDNGIGIDPAQAASIFTPFKRLHGRGEYEGTGIGLSICRAVVERHGGRIWVESSPGRGAHFRFTLGLERPAGVPPPEEAVPLPSSPG